jgi:hypothetical protein
MASVIIPIEPSAGGRLRTRLSAERPGALDYTIKRDWRRELDQEIRREGFDYFYFDPSNPIGNQPFPQRQGLLETKLPITLIHEAHNPKGETAVVCGTETTIYVLNPGAENKPYIEPGASPDDAYINDPFWKPYVDPTDPTKDIIPPPVDPTGGGGLIGGGTPGGPPTPGVVVPVPGPSGPGPTGPGIPGEIDRNYLLFQYKDVGVAYGCWEGAPPNPTVDIAIDAEGIEFAKRKLRELIDLEIASQAADGWTHIGYSFLAGGATSSGLEAYELWYLSPADTVNNGAAEQAGSPQSNWMTFPWTLGVNLAFTAEPAP